MKDFSKAAMQLAWETQTTATVFDSDTDTTTLWVQFSSVHSPHRPCRPASI